MSSKCVELPRIQLAVHTFSHSYLHLPAHLAKAGFEVDLLACRGNPLLASRSVKRRWPVARDEDLRDGEFYAVRDVSFELRRGEPGGG